tara:strand:+ start:846 stop:1214 length:369 start_codon:yes stop_codon:yes gene_type:complete
MRHVPHETKLRDKIMITKKQTVTIPLYVYATPDYEWRTGYNPDFPFTYTVTTNEIKVSGWVLVGEKEASVTVPAGFDITTAAVDGYKEELQRVRAEAEVTCQGIQDNIDQLLAITYQPTNED